MPGSGSEPEPLVSAPPKRNAGRGTLGLLAAAALALWGAGIALILHFERTAPHRPDTQAGQIYRFNDPFSIVYLSARQHALVDGALIVLPVVTILIVMAAVLTIGRMQSSASDA
jgi:hypothetical protein